MATMEIVQKRIKDGSCPEPNSGCWLWMRCVDDGGYGKIGGELAHRISWTAFIGPIPDDLCVLHHCDTPCCVRPDHLFLGDRKINAEDRETKGRNGDHRAEKN